MLKNMKIGKRLIMSFVVVTIIASIAGIVSIFTTKTIDTYYSNALIDYGFAQGNIGKTMIALADSRRCVRDIVSYTEEKYISSAKKDLEENVVKYEEYITEVEKSLQNDEEKALFQQANEAMKLYRVKKDEIILLGDTINEEQSKEARIQMVEELDPLYAKVYDAWVNIMNSKTQGGTVLSEKLTTQSHTTIISIIVLAFVAMAFSIFLGLYISKGISMPLKELEKAARGMLEGKLTTKVTYDSQDELGVLAKSMGFVISSINSITVDIDYLLGEMGKGNFQIQSQISEKYVGDFAPILNSMKSIKLNLSNTLSQINRAAEQVSGSSNQVSSAAQSLAEGASEQASSVEELAATISEISDQVNQNAENSRDANKISQQESVDVEDSNRKMELMNKAMSKISEKSNQIGKIIKAIEDIAFQTNILALNAAVEAARAGSAGKGFAVVADEVRNLATKSGEAAKDTAALIQESVAAVEDGIKITNQTAAAMLDVVKHSEKVSDIVETISEASQKQAISLTQVRQGIEQISNVVQTNSATAEESAAASEELYSQAQLLKNLVNSFKLNESL